MDKAFENECDSILSLLSLSADIKSKMRAIDAGVAYGLARSMAARLPSNHTISVRTKMLIGDLLQIPDLLVSQSLPARCKFSTSTFLSRDVDGELGRTRPRPMHYSRAQARIEAAAKELGVRLPDPAVAVKKGNMRSMAPPPPPRGESLRQKADSFATAESQPSGMLPIGFEEN